jgi:hypothetical protein
VSVPVLCERCKERRAECAAARRVRVQREPHLVAGLGEIVRERQLRQVLTAVLLLRRGRWTIRELAAELDQHWRSTYRMIAAIRLAGITVDATREAKSVYYSNPPEPLRRILRLP